MSDLTAFRDHARAMAEWSPPVRPEVMSATCHRGHIYGECHLPPTRCGCSCHDVLGPTPADRALWARLADEIDAYLAPPDEAGLWDDQAGERRAP